MPSPLCSAGLGNMGELHATQGMPLKGPTELALWTVCWASLIACRDAILSYSLETIISY